MNYFISFFMLNIFILLMSSSQWFFLWVGFEMMILLIIPLSLSCSDVYSSYMLKYYLIQSISSNIFLFSMMIMNFYVGSLMFTISMLLKLGSFPFYMWVVKIVPFLEEYMIWIILVLQKFIPLLILSGVGLKLMMVGMLNMLLGGMGGLFNKDMKFLITYSSIVQLGWMMLIPIFSMNMYMIYFSCYSVLMIFILYYLSKMKLYKSLFILMIFMLMGSPPFMLFWLKWSLLLFMYKFIGIIFMLGLLLGSMLSFYFYFMILFKLFII